MSWKDNISAEEKLCMEKLKKRTIKDLTPCLLEDETLFYRFSKARDFVIDDAEAMLRKHIIWREQYKIDRILLDYKLTEVFLKHKPLHFIGYDQDGSPLLYFDFGNCDIKGLFKSVTPNQYLSFSFYAIEDLVAKTEEQTKKLGKPVTMYSFIVNTENLTFGNATNKKCLETMLCFCKIFQDNYPERTKAFYIINSTFYFQLAFNVVKHVFAPVLLSKFQMFRPNDNWRDALLEKIDAEVLPAFLGGTRTDPDGNPLCTSVIPVACKVPEKYYMVNSAKKLSQSKDARKVTVTRKSKETWSCEVAEPGSYLEWEFETKNKDIGFSVLFKSSKDSKPTEVLPKQRIDTCYEPEKGFLRCDQPGRYICVFDNSYSWMHSKELYFKIEVTSKKEENITL